MMMISKQNKSIELSVGMVYSEEYITNFKRELQIKQGNSMKLMDTHLYLIIQCDNECLKKCGFHYKFVKKWDVQSKDCGFQLDQFSLVHSRECRINDEYYCFERNKNIMVTMKKQLTTFIIHRYYKYGPQSPKKILSISTDIFPQNWLFKGIQHFLDLKRKMKKRFDNLVAQIRKQNNLSPTFSQKNMKYKKRNTFSYPNDYFENNLSQIEMNSESQFVTKSLKKHHLIKKIRQTSKIDSLETNLIDSQLKKKQSKKSINKKIIEKN